MKRYWPEIAVLALQTALFWLLPLCAGPTDIMGVVVLMLCGTLLLSAVLGVCSKNYVRFAYPAAVMLLFIPSIPVYYNISAMIHVTWYLVLSAAGIGIGALLRLLFTKPAR